MCPTSESSNKRIALALRTVWFHSSHVEKNCFRKNFFLARKKKFWAKSRSYLIGMGLRRRLATEFVVVATPEHYTSKTCSKCFHSCGPFREVDKFPTAKEAQAQAPEEKKEASRLTIRSIRRCQNLHKGVEVRFFRIYVRVSQ